jgi:DNA-binding transcriptional MerR regulator
MSHDFFIIVIERKILYYPYVIMPDEWLKNSLLYWDKVSSIEPENFEPTNIDRDFIGKWFQDRTYLWNEGFYEPSDPWRVFKGNKNRDFTQEFINVIENERYSVERNWLQRSVMEVYEYKFNPEILKFLRLKNFVKQVNGHYFVERRISLIYLALLAKYLADIDRNLTTTNTDLPDYESIAYRPIDPNEGFYSYNMTMSNILPTPREETTLEQIVNFKKDYGSNIKQLRVYIRDVQKEVVKAQSKIEVKEILVNYKENLEMELSRLTRELNKSGIETFFSSIKTILQVKTPEIIVTLTGIGITQIPISLKVAGVVIYGLVNVGNEIVQKHYEREELKDDSPATYLYYAKMKGITD